LISQENFLKRVVVVILAIGYAVTTYAQQPMGSIDLASAEVSGGLSVDQGHAQLLANDAITARSSTATIHLTRGGTVDVCSTSSFHLLHSGTAESLVFALDRGAFEVHSAAREQDIVLTPDLRFTMHSAGVLDLRIRVTADGDTCVENTGEAAPDLDVSSTFGDAAYEVRAGQHMLFEHGDLHQVVDQETSSCGCPQAVPAQQLAAGNSIAAQHPFPVAQSEGLTAEAPMSNSTPGRTQMSVTTNLSYGGDAAAPATTAPATAAKPVAASPLPPASPPGAHDLAHAIKRFFRRLFGKSS
jgi:hypothetical protein